MPALEDVGTFDFLNKDEDDDVVADMNNLNTTIQIEEEVYVCQPPGFKDPDFPDRVYKVEKALFRLHQSPRACQDKYVVEILNKFGFTKVNKASTLIETQKVLLKDEDGEEVDVHMYRIFRYLKGQPKLGLWYLKDSPFDLVAYTDSDYAGASLDRKSTTGGMTHYCQLKVNAARRNLLLLEQFWSTAVAKTINGEAQIHAKVDGKKVIISKASIRRDLQFANKEGVDCLPNSTIFEQLALMDMGRNFDNLSGKILMYLRFIQVLLDKQLDGMSNHERKYILPSHAKKYFGNMRRIGKGFSRRIAPLFPTIVVQLQLGDGSTKPTNPHHTPTILQSSSFQPQKTHKPRKPKRKNTQVPQSSGFIEHVADEAVYKKLDDSLVRVATTSSSLEVQQDSSNIDKTQSKAIPNESSSQGTDLVGGLRCQKAIVDIIAQTRFANVSKHSNDSLLARGDTLRSKKDRMKLNELMKLCTNLQTRVIDLEKTKITQANEITSLKRRVKKLEKKQSLGKDASKQGRKINDIDADEDITLVNVQVDAKMFDANKDLGGEESHEALDLGFRRFYNCVYIVFGKVANSMKLGFLQTLIRKAECKVLVTAPTVMITGFYIIMVTVLKGIVKEKQQLYRVSMQNKLQTCINIYGFISDYSGMWSCWKCSQQSQVEKDEFMSRRRRLLCSVHGHKKEQ
uniref:Reverse transcriptase Ty1/copia-type domain-containing protein n=1 Tax=Tanacetum cinerariifolium TaxID=118510 RepID=A0A6L2JH99_TANCI|nr:hypothetical protein [Tanacetum cinerariifolium]